MFYYNYVTICNKKGISPSAAAERMGFHRSDVTRWGKGVTPRRATLQRIADFFDVPVSALTGEEDAEYNTKGKKPSEEELKAAFFEGADDLSQEDLDALWDDARDYIQYKIQQRRHKND